VDVSWNGGGRIHARRAVLEELAFRAALTWRAVLRQHVSVSACTPSQTTSIMSSTMKTTTGT
jgi:hypothetical protein